MLQTLTLQPSGAQTASGAGITHGLADDIEQLVVFLNVTAASGTTPTLVVTVQESPDGVEWAYLGAFAQQTAVGTNELSFAQVAEFVRVSWVIGGTTPSFTFDCQAVAR